MLRIFLFHVLALVPLVLVSGASVRGVAPDLQAYYAGGDTFTCITSGTHIPMDRVNDDVCDCADGTDEPGAHPLKSSCEAHNLLWTVHDARSPTGYAIIMRHMI
jgi:hypothetical protein